ncbi:MAG TPA: alpha/beta hydrolase-fold protein [Chitinophagaceae bacterium]|nr:alpha/beta hydrolase-fold protein [Chitinophagaceae bacterium]
MKHLLLAVLSAVIFNTVYAQKVDKIIIGKIDSVRSNLLRENRKIWIYTPDMTSERQLTGQRYPVLYLLDGDAHFASVVGLVQQLSQVNGNDVLPEMIIVGIPNTDRTRDLTPTHIDSDLPAMDSNSSKTSGGGQNFIAFIEKELMPHIDSAYPTAPYRVLVGHSFGGLTAIDALTNHTSLFNAYIAIDPSMWYDHERFLAATVKKISEKKYSGKRLFIGIANTMPPGLTLAKIKKDTSAVTRHIRSILELDKFLKANPQNQLKYSSRYYGDDSHGSVPMISEYDGLRFIFDYYRMNLTINDVMDTSAALAAKYKKHYDIVSKELGYKVSPQELFINYLGYDAMANKHYTKSEAMFRMNIDNYPNSNNVYDSYADLLTVKKDTANAIANYKKALAIQDNADTKRKLDALEGKAVFTLSEQELQKYTGIFIIEGLGIPVTLQVRNAAIWAIVPGQDDSELVPISPDTFTKKNASGYTISFHLEEGRAKSFTSVQPNGIFKAHLKK